MSNLKSSLFEYEENVLKTAKDLINSPEIYNDQLIQQYINLTSDFGKVLSEYKKIVKISDGQQEYLQQIQNNLKKEIAERALIEKELAATAEQLTGLNALKDKLFTIVSHDIRDPLAILVNLTELLEDEKAHLSSDSREIIDTVKEQVRNTYLMVENLLEWFRSQKGGMVSNPLVWELERIVRDTVRIFRFKYEVKNIRITLEINKGIKVLADRDALELVLRNLISNAIKYTENEGSVFIGAKVTEGNVIVFVRDTGIGIEPERIPLLFKEVQVNSLPGTAGEKGTGLGLMICKEFVKQNDGEIWVDSTYGEGSTFFFSLPAVSEGEYNQSKG